MTHHDFPWLKNTCYEPRPLPVRYRRRAWVRVFSTLAVLAIVIGALAGFNH